MQRHERNGFQPLAVDRAPTVIGAAQCNGIIALAHPRQHQSAGPVDDLQVDRLLRVVGEVLRGDGGRLAASVPFCVRSKLWEG
jgi:hypothetical protein